jgi:hypothetical protein
MKIVFCLSYLEIPGTMAVIAGAAGDFTVLVSTQNIYKIMTLLYPADRVELLAEHVPILSKSPFKILKNISRISAVKRETWERYKGHKNGEVYFFSVACCEFEAWLALKLGGSNRLFFKPIVDITHLKPRYTLYPLIFVFLNKMAYGVSMVPLWNGSRYYYAVAANFRRHEILGKDALPMDESVMREAISKHLDLKNKQVLLLVGGTVEDGAVNEAEYTVKMDQLIGVLVSRYGMDKISIKVHPRYHELYSREKEITEIPSYIPANMIYAFYNIIITYNSAALFEAANIKKTAISLLKYMPARNEQVKEKHISYLNSNANNPIQYPETLKDVEAILGGK